MTSEPSPFSSVDRLYSAVATDGPALVRSVLRSKSLRHLPRAASPPVGRKAAYDHVQGAAIDVTPADSVQRATGEFWERAAASSMPIDTIEDTSEHLLTGPALTPGMILRGRRNSMHGHEHYSSEARLDWVTGFNLTTRQLCHLPAEAVLFAHRDRKRLSKRFWCWNSSGLAAGPTFLDATTSALLELVERDAFIRHWLSREPAESISPAAWRPLLPARLVKAVDECRPWTIRVGQLRSELNVHVAIAVAENEHHYPALSFGAACKPSVETAITRAVLEAMEVLVGTLVTRNDRQRAGPPEVVHDFEDHIILAADPSTFDQFAWLIPKESTERGLRPSSGPPQGLSTLVQQLKALGSEVVVANLTTRDSLLTNHHVARVIAPGLQPIEGPHECRIVVQERLLGSPHDVNPVPHPFP